ncbi:DUF2752 domain-containing protein [Aestuariivivens sp. NBU2969]|uniref:DUF2752 domain-containing protein n=1 Tax=Aestuariivivens sp. NBU2969 TaxID=2873267 RepID=UPI001CBB3C08|nr:DUF2752 domain-containing protein [Aestuariivivens sp. NBU2969]
MSGFNDYMLPCLNKKLFGVECMGCGLQRSASLVVQGEFTDAFYMYPAIYTLILLLIVIVFNTFRKFKYSNKIITILVILNIVIIVTNFVSKLI